MVVTVVVVPTVKDGRRATVIFGGDVNLEQLNEPMNCNGNGKKLRRCQKGARKNKYCYIRRRCQSGTKNEQLESLFEN